MLAIVPARRRPALGAHSPRRVRIVFPSERFLLGAITADAAARMVFPNPPRSPHAGHNMATFDAISSAAASGQMSPAYIPGTQDCANVTLGAKAIITKGVGAAGGLLLKIGASSGNPIILGVGAAAELASLVFSAIFGHHAKAVAAERSILCAAVPAANQTLQVTDQALAEGNFSPQNAADALNAMLGQFAQTVAAIQHGADPTVAGECNAACVMLAQLRAIVARKISQYQDLAAAAASSGSSLVRAVTGGNVSSLLPWAAAGLALYFILKEA